MRILDESMDYGAVGGPGFNTNITETDSGQEERVSHWSSARHKFTISYTDENLTELKNFYLARGGAANGFRYKDWSDFTSNPDTPNSRSSPGTADQSCVPAQGDGSTTVFQLAKTYVSGLQSYVRLIRKPVAGSVRVWVDGSEVLSGWTVDTTTGKITFTSPPGDGLDVQASFEFDVPVRFDQSSDDLMSIGIRDYGTFVSGNITLIEIMEPGPAGIGEFNYGGSTELEISANLTISAGLARFWNISAASDDLSVFLPDPTGMPPGDHHFMIINGGSHDFELKNESGSSLVTLSADEGVEALLSYSSDGTTKTWYVM